MDTQIDLTKPILKRHDELNIISIGERLIRLTPTEYNLLMLLIERNIVEDAVFYTTVFHYQHINNQARINLDKHIDNLRSKIRPFGFDIFRILRLKAYYLKCGEGC